MNPIERYSRQSSLVPAEKLKQMAISIIGVGAIGRNVATQLSSIGVQNLKLIDFDTVEESNIASQGYLEIDMGVPKIEATARLCKMINSTINIDLLDSKYKRTMNLGNAAFVCVDSIDTRKFIWEKGGYELDFFVDGRMAAESLRILSVDDDSSREHYPTTLFASTEAFQGSCTAKSTVYCGNIAAGFMVSSFTKHLRGMPVDKDVMVNLFANEMSYGD